MIALRVFLACAALVLTSLAGAATVALSDERRRDAVPVLVALAVGVLCGNALWHLLPAAVARFGSVERVVPWMLGGILLFFLIETLAFHQHGSHHSHAHDKVQPLAPMNLVGDALHHLVDGALIAAAFMHSPTVGMGTTLAVIAHELPKEIGDVGVLIHGGYSPWQAVRLNMLCSLSSLAGAGLTLLLGTTFIHLSDVLVPLAAGGFLYLALADFMPSLHDVASLRGRLAQAAAIAGGMALMAAVAHLVPGHSH
jgi:zinc and cadmium transporter